MKLALECPTELLDDIQPLADFDFILAHLVLQDKRYARYYKESKRFKILDNSCNELRHPCSLDDIERVAEIVDPGYIMAPDFLGDCFSTEKSLDEAISRFGMDRVYPIIQGYELKYAIECFDYILKLGFDRVAVPYDICSKEGDKAENKAKRRLGVVGYIIAKVPIGFSIHLLGMNTLGELSLHNKGWVKAIDTGYPVMCGMYGGRFGVDELPAKTGPTLDMMETAPEVNLEDVYYNIAYLRKVLNGA